MALILQLLPSIYPEYAQYRNRLILQKLQDFVGGQNLNAEQWTV